MPHEGVANPKMEAPPSRPARGGPLWLCQLADIPDGGTRGLRRVGNDDQLLAVRLGASVNVYVNCCPHQHRPLEYRRDHFLAPDSASLMCYAHGSRFRIETGECFVGPALRHSLTAVAVRVADGQVWLVKPLSESLCQ